MTQFVTEHWSYTNSRVVFFPAATPPDLPVTAVKIYVFQGDTLLLTNIKSRGWDLPGGHIEPGETPEQAIVRELKEETGAAVKHFELIGYLKIINEEENARNMRYPKESCILVYKGYNAAIDVGHGFQLEASESKFVAVSRLPQMHHGWNEARAQVMEFAFKCR